METKAKNTETRTFKQVVESGYPETAVCSNCIFMRKTECRRKAPKRTIEGGCDDTYFPLVGLQDFCGDGIFYQSWEVEIECPACGVCGNIYLRNMRHKKCPECDHFGISVKKARLSNE